MNTEIFFDTYKNHPVLAVWEVDLLGNKKGKTPIVSFGLKKAQAILKHLDEVKRWVREQENTVANRNTKSITEQKLTLNLEGITPEKIEALKQLLGTF